VEAAESRCGEGTMGFRHVTSEPVGPYVGQAPEVTSP